MNGASEIRTWVHLFQYSFKTAVIFLSSPYRKLIFILGKYPCQSDNKHVTSYKMPSIFSFQKLAIMYPFTIITIQLILLTTLELLYSFLRASITKCYKLSDLKQKKSLLSEQILKSRCPQSHALSVDSRERYFLASSGIWSLQAILGYPWLVDT